MVLKEEKWIQLCSARTMSPNLLVQIYVDHIIFGGTNEPLCEDASWIQNEYDGRMKVLLRTIDETDQQWKIYPSN